MLPFLASLASATLLIQAVAASVVPNAFSNLAVKQTIDLMRIGKDLPFNVWQASLDWELPRGTRGGDTFSISLPHVFRLVGSSGFSLTGGGVSYANCVSVNGGMTSDHSSLTCTATDAVNDTVGVTGSLSFSFVFGSGGSANSYELVDAAFFKAGVNTISWDQDGGNPLTTTADFGTGGYSQKSDLTYYSRNIPGSVFQQYQLSNACNGAGATKGTLSVSDSTNEIMCDGVSAWITDEVNVWEMPMNAKSSNNVQITCTPNSAQVSYTDIPAGYRVFLTTNMKQKSQTFTLVFYETYLCTDGSTHSGGISSTIVINTASGNSTGTADFEVTTTKYWTGSVTSTTTLPRASTDRTATVVVQIPSPSPSVAPSSSQAPQITSDTTPTVTEWVTEWVNMCSA